MIKGHVIHCNINVTNLDHPQPYELGENESHIAFEVEDMQKAHAHHEQMGCICFENPAMGIYFIHDPDDYWLEVLPKK